MDKEKFVNEIKWIYGGLSGVCLVFFLALFSTKIVGKMPEWLSSASIFISIAFPICVCMLVFAVNVGQKQIEEGKLKAFINSRLYFLVFLITTSFISAGYFFLVLYISVTLAAVMLVFGLVGIFIVSKMNGMLGI